MAASDDAARTPKLLDPEFHARVHRERDAAKKGAKKTTLWCNGAPEYQETVWFSDATHTQVTGWRFDYCDGHFARQGTVTNFCDIYRECCNNGYNNEITTCEGP